jgi:hypothetical protein
MFDFKILFSIIFIVISDENVNQVFSQIHVRISYLFFELDMGFCLVAQPWTCKKIGGPSKLIFHDPSQITLAHPIAVTL